MLAYGAQMNRKTKPITNSTFALIYFFVEAQNFKTHPLFGFLI